MSSPPLVDSGETRPSRPCSPSSHLPHLSNPPAPSASCDNGIHGQDAPFPHPSLTSLSPPSGPHFDRVSSARPADVDSTAIPPDTLTQSLPTCPFVPPAPTRQQSSSHFDALVYKASRQCRTQQEIIDEMSQAWCQERTEKTVLISRLQDHIQYLEGEIKTLKNMPPHDLVPRNVHQSGIAARDESERTSLSGPTETEEACSFQADLYRSSRRADFTKQAHTEVRQLATADASPDSTSDVVKRVSVIDVQELDPDLDGIPIKVKALRNPTFALPSTHNRDAPSYTLAPGRRIVGFEMTAREPTADDSSVCEVSSREAQPESARPSGLRTEGNSKAILEASEAKRLTMHAGHTPNHSISILPTMTAAEPATDRSSTGPPTSEARAHLLGDFVSPDQSGFASPMLEIPSPPRESNMGLQVDGGNADAGPSQGKLDEEEPETSFEAADDVPLKGPLMIKNIPAQDELFWAKVDEQLRSGRGQDALPKVLQSPPIESGPLPASESTFRRLYEDEPEASGAQRDSDDEEGKEESSPGEDDVPLKLRNTSNFGAPFGSTRKGQRQDGG